MKPPIIITGPNGSGKTFLSKVMARMLVDDEKNIKVIQADNLSTLVLNPNMVYERTVFIFESVFAQNDQELIDKVTLISKLFKDVYIELKNIDIHNKLETNLQLIFITKKINVKLLPSEFIHIIK